MSTDAAPTPSDPEAARAQRLLSEGLPASSPAGIGQAPTTEEVQVHFPQLEIVEAIGEGGMGVVYKARQPNLDRFVALKILREELVDDPAFPERFAREARALARLDHPHIVRVHDFGEKDGLYYLLLEYVDGASLRDLIKAGKLAPAEALAIVPQICDALQYAHDQGIVHRDIKPENVLMDERGRVKIADFGLAKLVGHDLQTPTLTGTRQVMGTWQYMAPEQYQAPQDIDHRADIFSLGVVFYEMLTGELPVGRFQQPSEVQELDRRLDGIVMRALERQREARYQRADEVQADVEAISDPDWAGAPSYTTTHGEMAGAEGRSWLLVPALMMVLVAVGGAMATFHFAGTVLSENRSYVWMGVVGGVLALFGVFLSLFALRRVPRVERGWVLVALAANMLVIPGIWLYGANEIQARERAWSGVDAPPFPRPAPARVQELTSGAPLPKVEGEALAKGRLLEDVLETWQAWTRRGKIAQLDRSEIRRYYTSKAATDIEELEGSAFETQLLARTLGVGFLTEADFGMAPRELYVHHIRVLPGPIAGHNHQAVVEARPRDEQRHVVVRFPVTYDHIGNRWRFDRGIVHVIYE